jgi:hypothetical protein
MHVVANIKGTNLHLETNGMLSTRTSRFFLTTWLK